MADLLMISELRQASRQLVRELGVLQLQQSDLSPSHWHTLIECQHGPLTISELTKRLLLDASTLSRIVDHLEEKGYLKTSQGKRDKRTKALSLTQAGKKKIQEMDQFTNRLIANALEFIPPKEQDHILQSIQKYVSALSNNRQRFDNIKIRTLSNDRKLRHCVMDMIYSIQHQELGVDIGPEVNESILKAEDYYYFDGKCNFWYAIDDKDNIVGTIGLCKVNKTCAELKKCFIAPTHRGKGLSERLVHKLVRQAHKLGIKSILIGTIDSFKWAHKFYQKCGFDIIDDRLLPKAFDRCETDSVFLKGDVAKVLAHLDNKIRW